MQTYKSTRLTRTPHEKKKDNPSLLPLFQQVRHNHTHTSKKRNIIIINIMYAVASSAKVVAPTMRMQNSQTKRVVAKVPVKASSFNVEKVRRSLFCDRFFRDAFYDLRAFVTEARGAFLRRWIRGR